MKLFTITQFGNPILRQKAKRVPTAFLKSQSFKKLIQQMFITVRQADGVGLAAPQIDQSLAIAIIDIPTLRTDSKKKPTTKVIVNPRILVYSKSKELDWEGCLSLPGVRGMVPRSTWIKVQYMDEQGKKHSDVIRDFEARVFQHEIDHLNGVLFVDRMKDMKTLITESEYAKRQ